MTTTRRSPRPAPRTPQLRRANRTPLVVGAVVVVVAIALGAALLGGGSGSKGGSGARAAAPDALLAQVTSVPASVFGQVGVVSSVTLPKAINAPALTSGGLPRVVYVGAEYCPYCAAERWAMVLALSRFGTFTNLGVTHSSSVDVFPSTQTFSFHGASYTSQYLSFEGVEMQSNRLSGSTYAPLDTLTAEQRQLFATYDAPPYVPSSSAGAIPFVALGGRYLVSGASYSPAVLQGKSATQIAAALRDPSSPIAQGIVGTANGITAALCKLTGAQPSSVCADPVIAQVQARL
jgi:hypothetical protein